MTDQVTPIINHLHSLATLKALAEKASISEHIVQLQHWQCQRLIASHRQMHDHPKFNPAMRFFVEELYGPKDFSQRDNDIARVIPKMAKLLPEQALTSVASALHLNTLSYELDFDLVRQLNNQTLSRQSYAEAYRACNNQAQRQQQLDFIQQLGSDLSEVVNIRGISMLLSMSAKPAKIAGLEALHAFLKQGYNAFNKLGKVEDFIEPVLSLETQIMHSLFEGNADLLPDI